MDRKKVLDLREELPSFDVIVSDEQTVEVTTRDIYELAMEGAGSGIALRDRMDKVAKRFNEKFSCDLSEDKVFVLMMAGMEAVEQFVGNTDGSST